MNTPSVRAQVVTRRTYNRPFNKEGTVFETWSQTIDRVIGHQRWLWERALGGTLTKKQNAELEQLRLLMLERKALVAGRTLWLGGTEVVKRREASMFNCSGLMTRTVHDAVDTFWLLLQGCGVGFVPVSGTLCGFTRKMKIEVIRSTRTEKGGDQNNLETFVDGVWTIRIGDSAEAWAKAIGKLVAGKYPATKLVFDLSQIRPAGERLAGYGWICSGDENLSKALPAIAKIMNERAGKLLRQLDILDITNWLGTVLSSRRSAQIALMDWDSPEIESFIMAKLGEWWKTNPQRSQSNNSVMFWEHPGIKTIKTLLKAMYATGGGDPGIINAAEAKRRAPWFSVLNPCAEIALPDKGFCNLVTVDLNKFHGDHMGLIEAISLIARANYRQTVVNLKDGILQDAWHQQNEYLRLCGVSLTGYRTRPDLTEYDFKQFRNSAICSAYSMADELGLERPKNVTTGKPEGTLSKIMDTLEGCHNPLGKYIFNNIGFNKLDPIVQVLRDANYKVIPHPTDSTSVLACLPVEWPTVDFGSKHYNTESAVSQLERYKTIMNYYVEQNQSVTISYDESELDSIAKWLDKNWNNYVGVSFLRRVDPTKTAADIGYPYLPQEVVTEATYRDYVNGLKPVDIEAVSSQSDDSQLSIDTGTECAGGVCPIK